MQTFLPYSDFEQSASVLDRQRLGKQRVETMQIMTALVDNRGWIHHPAVKMWTGHEEALLQYQDAICREWVARGYRDNVCWDQTVDIFGRMTRRSSLELPEWIGMDEFHIAHQSNLLRKDPEYYGPYFPGVPHDLEYVWPIP